MDGKGPNAYPAGPVSEDCPGISLYSSMERNQKEMDTRSTIWAVQKELGIWMDWGWYFLLKRTIANV